MGNQWIVCCPGVPRQWENQRWRFLEETAAVRTISELMMDVVPSQEPGGLCICVWSRPSLRAPMREREPSVCTKYRFSPGNRGKGTERPATHSCQLITESKYHSKSLPSLGLVDQTLYKPGQAEWFSFMFTLSVCGSVDTWHSSNQECKRRVHQR